MKLPMHVDDHETYRHQKGVPDTPPWINPRRTAGIAATIDPMLGT